VDSASLFSLEVLGGQLKPIVLRFVIGGLCLSGIVYLIAPDQFLALPKNNLRLWFAIILLYPLLSVLPQELIYRTFLFQRYSSLIRGNPISMIIMSAVFFSLAHLVFNNWQALFLTALGGLMLAYTYHRSKSVICVSLEHAIWGNLGFTIGLGEYFSGGTIANMLSSL
jgi:membrane protease YdiL (CAAX protease family)